MRRKFNGLALVATLALAAMSALAQYGPEGGPYHPEKIDALIDQVQVDLNHGYEVWHVNGDDHKRLNKAGEQLREFAKQWHKGKFDKGNLNDSINAIQHVLDDNHLSGPERDSLWSDVDQLRKMREAYDRHEIGTW
jgi:hypothetical protein